MPRVADLPGLRPNPDDPDRALVARFADGDPAAFAALIDRHGPLVLGVCRRELGRSPLADDAFQATFLVLAQKARGLRNPDGLASWLFGVARRVALAARRTEARHAQTARRAPVRPPSETPQAAEWDELLRVVDEELARLPEALRAAVLLCLYHGKTQDEAATTLGWSLSTLRRKLEKGRELLKARLIARGATLGVGLLAGTLAPSATASVSPELLGETLDLAAGAAVGGPVPATIETLATQGVAMSGTVKAAAVATAMLLTGLAVAVGWFYWEPINAPTPPPAPQQPGTQNVAFLPDPQPPEPLPNPWVEALPPRAVARLGTTAFRHGSGGAFGIVNPLGVTQLSFLPDGTLVSIGGGRVRFWQTTTGQELHREGPGIPDRFGWSLRAKVFGDGTKLLLPDADEVGNAVGAATVWDLTTRTVVKRMKFATHADRKSAVISPTVVNRDGTRFVDVDPNGDAWVWDANGKPITKLAEKVAPGATQQFLPDGTTLLTVERDAGRCRMWNTTTGLVWRTIDLQSRLYIAGLSADGSKLATVGTSGDGPDEMLDPKVIVWDLGTGYMSSQRPLPPLQRHRQAEGSLHFTPDGQYLILVGRPVHGLYLAVRWWSLTSNKSGEWLSHASGMSPHPVAVSSAGNLLAVRAGFDPTPGAVRLFDWSTGREKTTPVRYPSSVAAAWFSDDGRTVVTSPHMNDQFENGTIRWDATTGKALGVEHTLAGPPPEPTPEPDPSPEAALYEAVGLRPAIGTPEQRRKQPNGPDAKVTTYHHGSDGVVVGMALLPITPTEAGRVYVVDVKTRTVRWMVRFPDAAPTAVACSPDGARIAVGTTVVRLFDAKTGKLLTTFDGHRGAITALSFSKDGKRLVSGSTDTTAIVWTLLE